MTHIYETSEAWIQSGNLEPNFFKALHISVLKEVVSYLIFLLFSSSYSCKQIYIFLGLISCSLKLTHASGENSHMVRINYKLYMKLHNLDSHKFLNSKFNKNKA